ncbi:MAG: hypothetical protein WD825_15380 [Gemmatimonadaceae bacterium]
MTTRLTRLDPVHTTMWGELYQGDCLDFLRSLPDAGADMVFADPPFNLGKQYGKGISDTLKDDDYLRNGERAMLRAHRFCVTESVAPSRRLQRGLFSLAHPL